MAEVKLECNRSLRRLRSEARMDFFRRALADGPAVNVESSKNRLQAEARWIEGVDEGGSSAACARRKRKSVESKIRERSMETRMVKRNHRPKSSSAAMAVLDEIGCRTGER